MYIYRTYFNLDADVLDIDEAQKYLSEDDMVQYLKNDSRISKDVQNNVESIDWILRTTNSGYIELKSKRLLNDKELESISDWVLGQCSDGIGEAFEQQSFANYNANQYNNDFYDEDEDEECYVMASFDWQTNNYLFELVSN